MSLISNQTAYQHLVYPKLPKAGLGNMLLVWAKAIVFAHINSFPVVSPNWRQIKIGPYIRRERDKRFYGSYFSTKNYISNLEYLTYRLGKRYCFDYNPPLLPIQKVLDKSQILKSHIFTFDRLPHWSDYFKDIKEHQPTVKAKLLADIHPQLLDKISNNPVPEIAIHVRMSDFRKIQEGENFAKLGNVRTPHKWFIEVLNSVRNTSKSVVPVTVFSDGEDHELQDLLSLPLVSRSAKACALEDMLTLSRSKILIASSGSTFSSWASYLGGCTTIWHPDHFHSGVFSESTSQVKFEGGFNPESMEMPDLLKQNIRDFLC